MNKQPHKLTNLLLILLLIICLWFGWSDMLFDKDQLSQAEIQEEIRESVRYYIRHGIQLVIQYVIPVSIVGYFMRKFSQ